MREAKKKIDLSPTTGNVSMSAVSFEKVVGFERKVKSDRPFQGYRRHFDGGAKLLGRAQNVQ